MRSSLYRALSLVLLVAACGGGDGGGGTSDVVEVIKWTPSGDNQNGAVATTLPLVLRVKVTVNDEVAAGYTVNWSGSGSFGTPSMVTGSNGIATTTWTMPEETGAMEALATVTGAVGSPVAFHATAHAGAAVGLQYVSGNNQAQEVHALFNLPFRVQVVDQFLNGVDGIYVHWSVTGPATVLADSVITTEGGFANGYLTGGDSTGSVTMSAAVTGLTGSPQTFTAAVVGPPAIVEIKNNFFDPNFIQISAGQSVKWVWVGSGHTVSTTSGPPIPATPIFNAGAVLGPVLFTSPGAYTYECSVHAGMTGTVNVIP